MEKIDLSRLQSDWGRRWLSNEPKMNIVHCVYVPNDVGLCTMHYAVLLVLVNYDASQSRD